MNVCQMARGQSIISQSSNFEGGLGASETDPDIPAIRTYTLLATFSRLTPHHARFPTVIFWALLEQDFFRAGCHFVASHH